MEGRWVHSLGGPLSLGRDTVEAGYLGIPGTACLILVRLTPGNNQMLAPGVPR